ncbi:MAG: hypothetical protein NTV86_12920 [Planctomycetota bacterium]|nr:hypothetical protein [Planctomycetota bacterium]
MNNIMKISGVVVLGVIAALGLFALVNYGWPAASAPARTTGNSVTMSPTPLSDEAPAVAVVNDRCPISGKAIDPAKVAAELTREFKGQKVGFCCGGCPPAWDKLSDDDKQAKLDKVLIKK